MGIYAMMKFLGKLVELLCKKYVFLTLFFVVFINLCTSIVLFMQGYVDGASLIHPSLNMVLYLVLLSFFIEQEFMEEGLEDLRELENKLKSFGGY